MDITNFPLAVVEALQAWINLPNKLVKREKSVPTSYLIGYRSVDFPSFYFRIRKHGGFENEIPTFYIQYRPYDEFGVEGKQVYVQAKDIARHFEYWESYILNYKTLKNPVADIEDIIEKQSEQEIYSWFELVDDDAEQKSYDTPTQLLLDKVLTDIIVSITKDETDINDDDKAYIMNATKELKSHQTILTKQEVVNRLSVIFARIKKVSIGLFANAIQGLIIEEDTMLKAEAKQKIAPFMRGFIK